jgi:predicted peptidase
MTRYGKVDSSRVYLTGLSYGGIQGFEIAYKNPTLFAAWVPVSGKVCGSCITGSLATSDQQGAVIVAPTLKSLPIWQFQGELDGQVSTAVVRQERDTFLAAGPLYKYTEYPGASHEIWDRVYADPQMFAWLYAQKR